jgi:hypothetical protein
LLLYSSEFSWLVVFNSSISEPTWHTKSVHTCIKKYYVFTTMYVKQNKKLTYTMCYPMTRHKIWWIIWNHIFVPVPSHLLWYFLCFKVWNKERSCWPTVSKISFHINNVSW